MERIAFKMKLNSNCADEYKKRHDEIWPSLSELLKKAGITDYSIFLDEETYSLFAVLKVTDTKSMDMMPTQDIMQKWWVYMSDIMESNADHSPVSYPLREVFYLP